LKNKISNISFSNKDLRVTSKVFVYFLVPAMWHMASQRKADPITLPGFSGAGSI